MKIVSFIKNGRRTDVSEAELLSLAKFDESNVTRDENGKFTSQDGGPSGAPRVKDRAEEIKSLKAKISELKGKIAQVKATTPKIFESPARQEKYNKEHGVGKRYFVSAMDNGYTIFDNVKGEAVKRIKYSKDEEFSKESRKMAFEHAKKLNEKS